MPSSIEFGPTSVAALGLTYLLHSLVWTALAALLARRSASVRNLGWKLALFAPIVSTLLATALAPALRSVALPHLPMVGDGHPATARASSVPLIALLAIAIGALRFWYAARVLRRRLRSRAPVHDARLLRRLQRLRMRMGLPPIALSQSAQLASPLVVRAKELCVPASLSSLSDEEIDAVFAHELAHLERGDWFWFPSASLVQSIFWMQPLHAWVGARFRRSAELACDDRAVEVTGDALALARALTQVADRAIGMRVGIRVPAMASSTHLLVERVKRLTEPSPRRVGSMAPVLLALGLVTLGLSLQAHTKAEATVDNAGLQAQMRDLDDRGQALESELGALSHSDDPTSTTAMRRITLESELRHVRAEQAWIEQRLFHAPRS